MAPQISQAVLREQLGETLVSQLTNVTKESDPRRFAQLCADMRRTLRNSKTGTAADMFEMDSKFKGLIRKARVKAEDDLADALEQTYSALQEDVKERRPMEHGIKMSTLPDHLQFLICLSLPPTPATHTYASLVLDKAKDPFRVPSALTWETIMAEEPFEGEHWKDIQSESHTRKGKRRSDSLSSSDSLDDLSEDDQLPSPTSSPPSTHAPSVKQADEADDFVSPAEMAAARAQMELDEMLDRQYWKDHWRIDVDLDEPFDLSKAETLEPTFMRVSASNDPSLMHLSGPDRGSFINEVDALREVLLALQGLENNLLILPPAVGTAPPIVTLRPSAPRLVHLTSGTYFSLLDTFAAYATVSKRLQHLLRTLDGKSNSALVKSSSLTGEAFTEAVEHHIRDFQAWCSSSEQALARAQGRAGPPLAVSLLSLSREVEERIDILRLLLSVAEDLQKSTRSNNQDTSAMDEDIFGISPSVLASTLLDLLFSAYKAEYSMAHEDNAKKLLQIFLDTAQPIWKATIDWIAEGRPGQLFYEEEDIVSVDTGDFFILHDAEVAIADPSFWVAAYRFQSLKRSQGDKLAIPSFLQSMASGILAGGKARAVLNTLGDPIFELKTPKRLAEVVAMSREELWEPRDLEAAVKEQLLQDCLISQRYLYNVVVDTCQMWHHLSAIEAICLFRRGDLMDDFADLLFDRLETRHTWFDYHAINAAFRDLVTSKIEGAIDPSIVRFWYTKPREDAAARMTRCLSGLSVTYEVPVPLLYLLTPDALQGYSSVFVLLMQVRRAKRLIDGFVVRHGLGARLELLEEFAPEDVKNFYAMRSKLSWFLNTLTYFLYTTVIHDQLQHFHKALKATQTLDDLIRAHDAHQEHLMMRCLLSESTASLHKAVLNILDIALHFGDCYSALVGQNTPNAVRKLPRSQDGRKRKTRRQRRQIRKQDVVGFSEDIPVNSDDDSSDSDVEDLPDESMIEQSTTFGATVSFADENLASRIDRMSNEMDRLVRYLRRGAEKLSGEGGPHTATFEVLAFSLEDWDL